MRSVLTVFLGVALAGNGAVMLLAPPLWYGSVPGVADTGPFNPHFVRDIGCAYLVSGGALTWFAFDARARAAALASGAFLALHALVHLWDAAAGRESLGHTLQDLPGVFAPAAIALWVAWPRSQVSMEDRHAKMADAAANRRF
jgi:hypothetical protein